MAFCHLHYENWVVSLLTSLRDEITWLRNELLFIQPFFKDAELKQCADHRVVQWVFEINSIANEAVAILETYSFEAGKRASCLKACACICRKEKKFYNVAEEIQSLKQRIMDISRKRDTYGITNINYNTGEGPSNQSSMVRTLRRTTSYIDEDHIFVGFQDVVQTLLSELLKAEPRQSVLSIYGMGGLGKITLARKLYTNPNIASSFRTHAWICVSQESRKSWESLKRAFPNSKNGSRVIITTRNEDVAQRADDRGFVHKLRFLTQEESWDLFCRKLVDVQAMIPAMESLAKDMVEKCRGLPLAIVVLSGLLSYRGGLDEWQKCFLYIGIFPEDQVIDAENIIGLWMAEGFIIPRGEERMEDVAEGFLNELIRRSLVQVAKIFWEKVTHCRVHDLLRDLAIQKASDTNLFDIYHPRKHSKSSSCIRLAIIVKEKGIHRLPSSIGNLKNLQTLVVNERGYSCELPCETADLINLRHLVALYSKPLKRISKLTSLEVLKDVGCDQWKDVDPFDLVNLRDLTMHHINESYSLNNISSLKTLCNIRQFEITMKRLRIGNSHFGKN
ncbi:hypothetical protein KY289_022277 [Solanum tuberosum]|nr:hypothetical protein KY289_022277 [Solanum tuberosum]